MSGSQRKTIKFDGLNNNNQDATKSGVIVGDFLIAILSLLLAIFCCCDLNWEDHVSIIKGSFLFMCGLAFFSTLYKGLNAMVTETAIGRQIANSYKLSKSDIYDISNKQVSAVQAIFCCITGITAIQYSCSKNMLKTSHFISEAYAWFGAAYFLYDIFSMYHVHCTKITSKSSLDYTNGDRPQKNQIRLPTFSDYLKCNAVIVGHHIFIGAFGFLVITYLRGGLGDCFFGFIYLMEASTPFVSIRGILSKFGMKSSIWYVINGLVMLGMFFLCRIAMFPYVLNMYAKSIQQDFLPAVLSLPRGCLISISILLLPQIYWFFVMLRGASKILTSSSTSKRKVN